MRIAILTVSDRSARGERPDAAGPALRASVERFGGRVVKAAIVPDEIDAVAAFLRLTSDSGDVDVILTTGGTGVAARDITPDATLDTVTRRVPGIPERMRAVSLEKTPNAMLSRAEAGIRGTCLIINLPGSPKGAVECFEAVAPAIDHAVQLLRGEHPDG